MLLWLLLLGLMTYWLLKRGVARVTRTPVWLLWLVMMMPALIWGTWILIYGNQKSVPVALMMIPFIVCPCLYWYLVQAGRQQPPEQPTEPTVVKEEPLTPEKLGILARPLEQQEEETLRSCFPWTVFPLHNLEYRLQSIICRGQLRSNPDVAYRRIREQIEAKFGDRFIVAFQQDLKDKPFFALVPNPYRTAERDSNFTEPITRPVLAFCLFLITLFTTTLGGVTLAEIPQNSWQGNPNLLLQGLPYAVALMGILGIHESAHYLMARWYKIRATLPYFIPLPFWLGTLGAFVQLRSPIPHRKALFDVNMAGPWAGFIVTLPILIWGLTHSTVVPLDPQTSGFLNFESLNPSFSFLLTVLSKFCLGDAFTSEQAIHLHPVAIAGYLGLIFTAFNLIPVGQLNGGQIIHAMFGHRTSLGVGQITRFLILILALINNEFLILAVLLFFLPLQGEPALNDVSELDNKRDILGFLTLFLLLLIILPVPGAIAQWLNYVN